MRERIAYIAALSCYLAGRVLAALRCYGAAQVCCHMIDRIHAWGTA